MGVSNGNIYNSYTDSTVKGENAGGLAGSISGKVTSSYSKGSVRPSSITSWLGGLTSHLSSAAVIRNNHTNVTISEILNLLAVSLPVPVVVLLIPMLWVQCRVDGAIAEEPLDGWIVLE